MNIAHLQMDIAKHASPYDDGYEIAKALESYGAWTCDFQMAECLDGFALEARQQLRIAEKEWAAHNDMTPPYAIGTHVKWRDGTGEITGIYERGPAQYLVKNDKEAPNDTKRYIVNFEDVEALTNE